MDEQAAAVRAVQFGDLPTVKGLLDEQEVSANACDIDGCSLLHWAAINNRMAIATLLINRGANVSCSGGILKESPLHWAVRRDYGRMVDLLVRSGADLGMKSDTGQDALTLACRLGLKNMVCLLLALGADVDPLDHDAETPLVHCLKNNPSQAIVRILLEYHADISRVDSEGNNGFHLMIPQGHAVDIILLNDLFNVPGSQALLKQKNKSGKTPLQLAWAKQNLVMVRYLWDAAVYHACPRWFGPAVILLSVTIVPWFLQAFGWIWGLLYLAVVEIGVLDKLSTPNVFPGYIHSNFYIACGISFCLVVSYLEFVHIFLSSSYQFAMIGGFLVVTGLWYMCINTPPRVVPAADRSFVIASILRSCPTEGPPEDTSSHQTTVRSTSPSHPPDTAAWSRNVPQDIETAPLMETMEGEDVEPFSLCPKCIVDRSGANHCNRCQQCVVDMNYHCMVTLNCVGAGNRRVHTVFLLMVCLLCLLYLLLALSVQGTAYCPNSHGVLRNFFAVQFCIFPEAPALALVPPVLFCILNYSISKLLSMVSVVALETTQLDMTRRRNRFSSMQYMSTAEILKRFCAFLISGDYRITRRSQREVDAEEQALLAEQQKLEEEKRVLREKHQGRIYRAGSFDNSGEPDRKQDTHLSIGTMNRIER